MSSWIDGALEAGYIRRVFDSLLSAREALEDRPGSLPPLAPDADTSTYWTTRVPMLPSRQVRPVREGRSPEAFEAELGRHWEEEGLPELVALAPAFRALAERLRGSESPGLTVPQLIYTMF